jgi:molecular chaperone HscA
VRYDPDGVVVGFDALRDAAWAPDRTFTSVKRLMGRSLDESALELQRFRQGLAEGDKRVVRFEVPGRDAAGVTPVEISAEILRVLRKRAEGALLGHVGGAVVTVPAYFDDAQRQATRDAARLAGLDLLRLLNEPTAAALAYGLEKRQRGLYAIFDLGGGTFDISILRLTDGVFEVLATAGDTQLGGDDLDLALAEMALEAAGRFGESLSMADQRILLAAARETKHRLSDEARAPFEALLGDGPLHLEVTREAFEARIRPIVERTAASCRRALHDAHVGSEEDASRLDGVVLVGGSTRVPLVRSHVRELFGVEPFSDIDPDEVVALGAALQADILGGRSELSEDLLLLDVLPLSFGIEVMGGIVERIIPRCSTIPAAASQTFTTHLDGQSAVDIHVLQGERELVADNRSLARFKLRGIPPMPAGIPRIEVSFLVDADGILRVSARERHTGVEAGIEVTPSHGLTDDEIEAMLEDALENAESDVDQRMLIEARVEAEQILAAVARALSVDSALLAPGEEDRIQSVVRELSEALGGEDRHRVESLNRRLDEVTAPFAQRRIERDLQLALQGQAASDVARKLGVDPDGSGA